MKVMFDTNIYISWIRARTFEELMLKQKTVKYMSAIVLMELWAGARTKQAVRLVETLQNPYMKTGRVIPMTLNQYIQAGILISKFPPSYKKMLNTSGFTNDIQLALTSLSIGATLFTNNKNHFKIINSILKTLKVVYV